MMRRKLHCPACASTLCDMMVIFRLMGVWTGHSAHAQSKVVLPKKRLTLPVLAF